MFTAALAANGIDILGAEVNSLASGIALGALTLAIARSEPAYSFAGQSIVRAGVELAATARA